MNIPHNRPLVGSRHVDCLSFRWLKPVRSNGSVVHYVEREAMRDVPNALCGERPPSTERGTKRWRIVHAAGGKVCASCHASSCDTPSRIDFS
jgi:hypothetical protein